MHSSFCTICVITNQYGGDGNGVEEMMTVATAMMTLMMRMMTFIYMAALRGVAWGRGVTPTPQTIL